MIKFPDLSGGGYKMFRYRNTKEGEQKRQGKCLLHANSSSVRVSSFKEQGREEIAVTSRGTDIKITLMLNKLFSPRTFNGKERVLSSHSHQPAPVPPSCHTETWRLGCVSHPREPSLNYKAQRRPADALRLHRRWM